MRTIITVSSIGLAILLLGCGGSPAAPPPDTGGLAALDAQATLAVWSARETAVADETRRAEQATVDAANAAIHATAQAGDATAAAIQAADATAAAYGTAVAVEATATAGAGYVAATAQANAATATRDALAAEQLRLGIAATATADAAALAFQEAQADKALAAKQAEIDRAAMWNRLLPWIVGIVVSAAGMALVLAAGVWAVERLRRTRPQQAGDVWVMVGPGGPVALNRPPAQIPATLPRANITVTAPPPRETPAALPVARRGCWLVAGKRDSGKTTALKAIAARRRGTIIVVDPRDWEGKWNGVSRVIGRGGDYAAIEAFLVEEMEAILTERGKRLGDGVPDRVLQADPVFVMIDELPAIVERLGANCMTSPRRWMYEMRQMGGDLLLSTQSLHVRAMGLKDYGDVRRMFDFTLALGDIAVAQFPDMVRSMARPAVLSTLTAARSVVIPFQEADAEEPAALPPIFVAPTPPAEPKADPRNLKPDNIEKIRRLLAAGWSQRAVEDEMFGYTGGAAWEAVARFVEDGSRSVACDPTPGYQYSEQ